MKKLFTTILPVLFVLAAFAQQVDRGTLGQVPSTFSPKRAGISGNFNKEQYLNRGTDSRAVTNSFAIDYDTYDESYAAFAGFDYDRSLVEINGRTPVDSVGVGRYAIQVYDTLIDLYTGGTNNVWPHISLPYSALDSLYIDSVGLLLAHVKNSGSNVTDTLRIRIYDNTTYTQIRRDTGIVGTPIWEKLIPITASLTGPGTQPGTFMVTLLNEFVGITMPSNHQFSVQVDYYGPVEDQFFLISGFRNNCGGDCVGSRTIVPSRFGTGTTADPAINSLVCYNFGKTSGGQPQYVFADEVYYDCNGTQASEESACELDVSQNLSILPQVTAKINFGASIAADSLRSCPGGTINLSANPYGLPFNTTYDYNWATSTGNLTVNNSKDVSLVLGTSDAVVTVTVTDANNTSVSTTATVTVRSNGINISTTGSNPLLINCSGGSVTTPITTTVTGVTANRTYTWSTGESGNVPSVQIKYPGTYSVTVQNGVGCTASASVQVQYNGGVTNTVAFTAPSGFLCQNKPLTFNNSSAKQDPSWTPLWYFSDGNTSTLLNGQNTFVTPGVFQVRLTMDSAGCVFTTNNQNITILSANDNRCINDTTGINDIAFENDVKLMPNPTTGNVTINVTNVEKNVSVKVYNILGSQVFNFNTTDVSATFTRTFDLNELANGTYLVKIETGSKTAVKRLTVAK